MPVPAELLVDDWPNQLSCRVSVKMETTLGETFSAMSAMEPSVNLALLPSIEEGVKVMGASPLR